MSVITEIFIYCDGDELMGKGACGNPEPWSGLGSTYNRGMPATHQRHDAAKAGWSRPGSYDLCPECTTRYRALKAQAIQRGK